MPEPLSLLVSTVVKNFGATDIISLNYDGKHTVRLAAGESLRILGDPLSCSERTSSKGSPSGELKGSKNGGKRSCDK
jgi:hypothetical protein